jgi:probable HAF family extracellular repeat protein
MKTTTLKISGLCLLFLGILFFVSNVFGQYQIIDLGTLPGGTRSTALSINNNGQIVGYSSTYNGKYHATLFDSTGAGNNINLRTITDGGDSYAYSINDRDQIIGWAYTNKPDPSYMYRHAILFDPTGAGHNTDLGTLGGNSSMAYSINDNGQIAGGANTNSKDYHVTLFDPTGANNNIDIGRGDARAINNQGQIVGQAYNSSGILHATLFDSTDAANNIDLGSLSNLNSYANSINDSGQIVGYGYLNTGWEHAVLFDSTGAGNNIDLGTFGGNSSMAYSNNNNNQIVGTATYPGGSSSNAHATLFDSTGAGHNIDLNAFLPPNSGWLLVRAYSINDNGWIVGEGYSPNNPAYLSAYLLKPIPEPCTITFLSLGGLFLMRRRKLFCNTALLL